MPGKRNISNRATASWYKYTIAGKSAFIQVCILYPRGKPGQTNLIHYKLKKMQPTFSKLFPQQTKEQPFIFNMLPSELSNVPFHAATKSITRYFAEAFPLHMAVHHVSPVFIPPQEYTTAHIHEESDEINIIISSQKLVYKIQLGDNEYIVQNNTAIWIPRGLLHAANVLKGSGYFIALRLD